jgi:hypothetical protein
MKHLTARRISACPWVILLFLTLFFGCSTLPTVQPAKDVKSIRGKWEGWGENQLYGRFFAALIITEDGEWQMRTDTTIFRGNEFSGKAWVSEGKFEFFSDTPQLRGTYTLHVKEEKRWLVFRSDDGDTTAELLPSFR